MISEQRLVQVNILVAQGMKDRQRERARERESMCEGYCINPITERT